LLVLPQNDAREVLKSHGIITLVRSYQSLELGRHGHASSLQMSPECDSWNATIDKVTDSLSQMVLKVAARFSDGG
jgi:hypothetical protein